MTAETTVRAIIDRLNATRLELIGVQSIKAHIGDLHGAELRVALKTVAYYERSLNRAVLDFYRSDIEAGEFIDEMIRLVEGQFERAWNEGSRAVGVDPKDHTEDDDAILQERIDKETEFILDYAQAVEDAREAGAPVKPLQDRVLLWANRYNEIVNEAKLHFGAQERLEWIYGDTVHCTTCEALNGIVATAEAWAESGYKPQSAPNDLLECGGWRCQCKLEPTKKPATEGGIP